MSSYLMRMFAWIGYLTMCVLLVLGIDYIWPHISQDILAIIVAVEVCLGCVVLMFVLALKIGLFSD